MAPIGVRYIAGNETRGVRGMLIDPGRYEARRTAGILEMNGRGRPLNIC